MKEATLVSGLYSGPSPSAGLGVARSLRAAFPSARLVGVAEIAWLARALPPSRGLLCPHEAALALTRKPRPAPAQMLGLPLPPTVDLAASDDQIPVALSWGPRTLVNGQRTQIEGHA